MNKEDGLALCDEILELLEELPERAEMFREGIEQKTLSMKSSIESRGDVTDNMANALENMKAGVERWIKY